VASFVVRHGREPPYNNEVAILLNNASGLHSSSNCGALFFVDDNDGLPADICQDKYGRVAKYMPASTLQSVITTLQSPIYDNYLWMGTYGVAYFDGVARRGAGAVANNAAYSTELAV
jgi:hypothetical protein